MPVPARVSLVTLGVLAEDAGLPGGVVSNPFWPIGDDGRPTLPE